ncbi:MAG: alpha-2-macroglobulin, partial [bacterium]
MKQKGLVAGAALLTLLAIANAQLIEPSSSADLRKKAQKLNNDGNYKDALEIWQPLAVDQKNDPSLAGSDMLMAVTCLQALNRDNESDDFREKLVGIHSNNWRILYAAGQSLFGAQHYGTIIAGKFERGPHRGGGRYVNSFERDRCRALQLMEQARSLVEIASAASGADQNLKRSLASFYLEYAQMLMGYRGYQDAWRLQYLTDLSKLPDYEEGYWRGDYGGNSPRGAPVDKEANPVFHKVPKQWAASLSDGERWRWMLLQAMELDPGTSSTILTQYAEFLHHQFGVETIADYGNYFRGRDPEEEKTETGSMYQLHTLGEDETIARLATGVKRFKLPEDVNFIAIYRKLGANDRLGEIFENRRQYDKAADCWQKAGRNERVEQILGNWGQFEPVMTYSSGKEAGIDFRFRNGTKVHFTAQEINVRKLLDDVKEYLKSNPGDLNWENMDVQNIGYRLVEGNQTKYVEKQVAEWDLDLKPRIMHFDKRITIQTPLKKAGAYLLTAKMT